MVEGKQNKTNKQTKKHNSIHSQVLTRLFTSVQQFSLNDGFFKQISQKLIKIVEVVSFHFYNAKL